MRGRGRDKREREKRDKEKRERKEKKRKREKREKRDKRKESEILPAATRDGRLSSSKHARLYPGPARFRTIYVALYRELKQNAARERWPNSDFLAFCC